MPVSRLGSKLTGLGRDLSTFHGPRQSEATRNASALYADAMLSLCRTSGEGIAAYASATVETAAAASKE
jgi:hypothetical protein